MQLKAYILAADPTFIEKSVLSYYELVEEIVVSYDEQSLGWTGALIPVNECLTRLKTIDYANKMRFCAGNFARSGYSPMQNDVNQRQTALAELGSDTDWILQLDTDEVLPNPSALLEVLEFATKQNIAAVEWPMRIMFRELSNNRFLEISGREGQSHFEYPGPIAIRPNQKLYDARRAKIPFIRPVVKGDNSSLQIARPTEENEIRVELAKASDAIIHYSWAGSPARVKKKIASWGHNQGWQSWLFYYTRWKPAPLIWRNLHDFHPFAGGLWPALKLSYLPLDLPITSEIVTETQV